jgi:hypothetical protein
VSPPNGTAPQARGAEANSTTIQAPTVYPEDRTEVDHLLARVRAYEAAARAIADDPTLSARQKMLGLIDLGRRGQREELPRFIEAAIWAGCRTFIEGDRWVPKDIIQANRRLLRRGLSSCPTCRRPLPDAHELDRWRRLGHDEIVRTAV